MFNIKRILSACNRIIGDYSTRDAAIERQEALQRAYPHATINVIDNGGYYVVTIEGE